MTVRTRYTSRMKARHLAALARMTYDSLRPTLELVAATAHTILSRRYIDRQD